MPQQCRYACAHTFACLHVVLHFAQPMHTHGLLLTHINNHVIHANFNLFISQPLLFDPWTHDLTFQNTGITPTNPTSLSPSWKQPCSQPAVALHGVLFGLLWYCFMEGLLVFMPLDYILYPSHSLDQTPRPSCHQAVRNPHRCHRPPRPLPLPMAPHLLPLQALLLPRHRVRHLLPLEALLPFRQARHLLPPEAPCHPLGRLLRQALHLPHRHSPCHLVRPQLSCHPGQRPMALPRTVSMSPLLHTIVHAADALQHLEHSADSYARGECLRHLIHHPG